VGYVDFVRELGPDQPIYGLQSIGLDGRAEPFKSIEAMARHYLVEVRAHQPQGPYAFIGACFGATVAYEMARQLMAAGEVVAFLGLIAPTARGGDEADERLVQAPRVVRRAVALANLVRGRLRGYLRDMHGLSLPGRLRYLVRKVQSLSATVMQPHGLKGAQRELNQLEVYRANLHALDSYARRPLDGVLFAFEILETAAAGLVANRLPIDWEAYWQGPLKWHVLPGRDSGDMLAGANAAVVATLLTERLRAAFEQSVSAASAAPARQTDASA
jgi:thioesterase domain-containing protein